MSTDERVPDSLEICKQRLKAAEERFYNIIETNADGILIVDKAGMVCYLNPAAQALWGRDADSLLGTHLGLLIVAGEKTELDIMRPDGSVIVAEMRVVDSQWESKPVHLASLRDVTERKRDAEKLRLYSEQLERMVEARTQELQVAQQQLIHQERLAILGKLSGAVGHELRNPLGVISNATYLLNAITEGNNPTVLEYLDIISKEVHQATKIICDLLDFANINSANRQSVAVSDLVEKVLNSCRIPENVSLTTEIAPSLPAVFVDPQQMAQVLMNIIANAYQSMTGGGEIRLAVEPRVPYVNIAIADTGPGITPENMDKIFEPLFTTRARGIGLGLALSKKLVTLNQGQIIVSSEVGKGSIFTIRLPVEGE